MPPATVRSFNAPVTSRVVTLSTLVTRRPPISIRPTEETSKRVPGGTAVVKAFNTTFAQTLVAGAGAGESLQVLIAGDDARAKAKVAGLVESGGMMPVDVGPLARARMLEQVGLFHIAIQEQIGAGFASALKLHW